MNNLNKLISFKIKNKKEFIKGLTIDYNADWTIVMYNPVDYVIDGYCILRNSYIINYEQNTNDSFRENIIKLKLKDKDIFPPLKGKAFEDIANLICYKYLLIGIEQVKNTKLIIGKYVNIIDNYIVITPLSTNGLWLPDVKIFVYNICMIYFDNDYQNSLRLMI